MTSVYARVLHTASERISRTVQPRGDRRGVDDGRGRLPADVVETDKGEPATTGRVLAEAVAEREEEVLAVVALALADRAVQPRVEALAVREYLSGHDLCVCVSVVQDSTVSLRLVPLVGVMTGVNLRRLRCAPESKHVT